MSLMFAKQFSEAGVTSTTSAKKGGRGRGGGSGLMSKSKRGGRGNQDDAGDASGLFNMDNNSAYRTHMLFPGRKDDDGSCGEPRRSSGSPSFMKAMMSWGKRPSDPKSPQNSQELTRYRATPTRASESEFDSLLGGDPYYKKTVSFNHQRSPPLSSPASPASPPPPPGAAGHFPTSPLTNNHNGDFFSYHEPFRENDYASFVGGMLCFTNILHFITYLIVFCCSILK